MAPSWVRDESMTIGKGRSTMICVRQVRPSMLGILMSNVITSGCHFITLSMASIPSRAVLISAFGMFCNMSLMVVRINAESSTTKIFMFPPALKLSYPYRLQPCVTCTSRYY
ncbi:Uncharacterised protein [Vibrio cholerae]|nr:Uncharacterised protein [Vibrio cholerae]CSI51683.1 Uncharacterised protein [Vibrio cholerae]